MYKFDRKIWNYRVRKTVIISLAVPLLNVMPQAPVAYAAPACVLGTDYTRVSSAGSSTVIYRFTNTAAECTFTLPTGLSTASILAVGGGGGGGTDGGSGGGGGELRYNAAQSLTGVSSVDIWVGSGGAGGAWGGTYTSSPGTPSTLKWSGSTQYQANGGLGGGSWNATGPAGGVGGSGGTGGNANSDGQQGGKGPSQVCQTSAATSTNGFSPTGTTPSNSITGSSVNYGGGGGGGFGAQTSNAGSSYLGAAGGGTSGGRGANYKLALDGVTTIVGASAGAPGAANTGGGGGGGSACDARGAMYLGYDGVSQRTAGGNGANGVVIISFARVSQTITFGSIANRNVNAGALTVAPTSSSGLTVELTSATTSVCTVSGFVITPVRAGTCTINANQAGSDNYAPATQVQQSFAITGDFIQYSGNSATSTRNIESTTASLPGASNTLSNGKLERGNPISNGLVLNLDASDASTVSGSSWANKVAGVTGAEASATLIGSPTYDATEGAFTLDGSSQFFTLGTSNYLFNGALPFTLNISFKSSDVDKDSCLIDNFNGGVGATYLFRINDGVLRASRNVSPWEVIGTTKISAGEIIYASFSFDSSYMRLYLNGNLYATSALINGSVSYNGGARIGACRDSNSWSRFFKGQIYNAQIYDRALSGTEIATNYENLLPGRIVSKDNYTLGSWNTQSNGTGTSYGTLNTDLSALPTPYFRVSAENYSGGTLSASVGGSNLSITKTGSPVLNSNSGGGFGANARFPTISGTTTDGFRLGNAVLPNYTFCGMARYKDLDSGVRSTRGRIFAHASTTNWISGWYNGGTKNFYHNSFVATETFVSDPYWHVMCESGNRVFWDGVKLAATASASTSLPPLAINWAGSGDNSHYEFTEAIVYNSALSDSEINTIFRYFESKFGLTQITTSVQSAARFLPPSNYSSTGNATLQATWVSQITYDGNKQTSGTVPNTQSITNAGGTVASAGSLARSGYVFAGWNTASDGSGTRYAPGAALINDGNKLLYAQWVLPVTLPTAAFNPSSLSPYLRLEAPNYDSTNKIWRDSSGNSRNVTRVIGTPTITTTTGNGASKSFQTIAGGTADKFYFDNDPISTNWTVFALSRYSGASNQRRIISGNYSASAYQDSSGNWLFGQYNGYAGLAHYNGWVSPESTPSGLNLTDWVMSTAYPYNYRYNGIVRGTSGGTAALPPLGINTFTGQQSDYQVAEVIIFDRTLTSAEISKVEDYFDERYGLSYAKVGSYQTANTLAIAATIGGRSDTFTATDGLGNKTFLISPTVSGITLDTSTANAVAVVVSGLVPAGTYIETITATDQAGYTASHVITITVAEAVRWSASNPTSLVTTIGRPLSQRLDITGGMSGKVATLRKPTTVPLGGISIDTSTLLSSNYVTLNIGADVLPGAYSLTLSITDDTKRVSNQLISVTVNNLPALSFTQGINDTTTTVTRNGLWLQYEIGKSWSGTGTSMVDLAGNNTAGTITANTPYSSSLGGGSASLDGTKMIWLNTGVIQATDSLSKFYWIYPTSATGTIVKTCDAGCNYHESELEMLNGKLYARVWNLSPVSTNETITINAWHYVGYVYDRTSGNTFIYVDGRLAGSIANSGTRGPPSTTQYDGISIGDSTYMATSSNLAMSFGAAHYYKRTLSATEVFNNFAATAPRYFGTTFPGLALSGTSSITTTQGVAKTYPVFTASSGTGNKILGITPGSSGITIDTSTANSAILNIANTVSATSSTVARVYTETVTAIDSMSAITNYRLTITVNPPITLTPTIANTVTTTFGIAAYDTFTASYGTGTYTFSNKASSYQSAFTLTKTTSSVAVLTIANNLPAGTYIDTVTVTDAAGAVTDYPLTIIVNPGLTLSGATSNSVSTTVGRSTSMRVNVSNGTGARTMTITSPHSGITLDSSTITSGYVTINFSTAVPLNSYSIPLIVRDSLGATKSETFTATINKWPYINSTQLVSNALVLNLDGSSYSGAGQWIDSSGNGYNATLGSASTSPIGTSPAFTTESGGYFDYTANSQHIQTSALPSMETFTVSVWVKMSAASQSGNPAIVAQYSTGTNNVNFTIQSLSGKIVGGYRVGGTWSTAMTGFTPDLNTWMHVTYVVAKNGTNSYSNRLYKNGVLQESITTTTVPTSNGGVLLLGRRWDLATATFTGDIAGVTVHNRALSQSEIQQNYNFQARRFTSANSGSISVETTEGLTRNLGTVVAIDGTGTKAFALSGSPTTSGFTLETSTPNQFSLAISSSVAATNTTTSKTYYETVTATDSTNASTAISYIVNVNPPVQQSATSMSITTTSGVAAYDTFTAMYGTGNKTFFLTGSPTTSGFTLTQTNNLAVLKVEPTVNPGTYYETVTATDSLGASKSVMITVVVTPPPTILGISRIESTKGVALKSPLFAVSGGTGTLTMTVTNSPSNSNITLIGATSAGAYLSIGASSETGTYLSTLRVTDEKGSYSELVVTIVVNAPVTLSGSLSITKTYGTSATSGYSTNGSGTAPFSFSATPVCAVVRNVSGSYTYDRINGTDQCTWTAPSGVSAIDALLVGAGGGGGSDGGAGGGGGSINTLSSVAIPVNKQISVQVGSGGAGGVFGGTSAVAGGTTSLTSGPTTYTAPGGAAGGGCGSASASGGSVGSGGTATAGGNGGYGATGTGCGSGTGSVGSNGPSSDFTGVATNYGGGGGGGPYPAGGITVGPNAGGAGGGGAGAASTGYSVQGLAQYFRSFASTPTSAASKEAFTTGTCAAVIGNINYSTDSDFPCADKDNFQGYATGYFIAPVSGSFEFYLYSDDSSALAINVNGTERGFTKAGASTTYVSTGSIDGFVAGAAYPINVYFTEMTGSAAWKLEYSYSGQARTPIPASQLRTTDTEGLIQYFRAKSSPENATSKTEFTSGACGIKVGNISYAQDSDFPCPGKDNFQGYATGYFIAPYTGSIKFYLTSDDSSDLVINVNGTNNELQLSTCCTTVSTTWSGFVKGQYYPIKLFFTEITGLASWKLEYEYSGQSKIDVPVNQLRPSATFTSPVQGTNGLGGGGGGGSAGVNKITGGKGGSGTAILKYLTPSDSATANFISAIVNQESPSGLLTLNVPEYVNVGVYYETITVQDAANSAPYQAVVTITVNKATPTISLSLPGSVTTAKYGTPVSISVNSVTPGWVNFKDGSDVISGCESVTATSGIATCSWTPSAIGSRTITAKLTPTDTANYNSSADTTFGVTVGKADTMTVTATDEAFDFTNSAVLVTKRFTYNGLVSIDTLTAVSMVYSGSANDSTVYSSSTAPTLAGIYLITPDTSTAGISTIAGNYASIAVVPGTLTINRISPTTSFAFANSNTVTYAPNATLASTANSRSGDGARTYSTDTPSKCSISDTPTVSVLEAGSCIVNMIVAQSANYLTKTDSATITINKASRTISLSSNVASLKYTETATVTTTVSGGADDGTVTYGLNANPACSFDALGGVLTAIAGTGTCTVSADISEGTNYLANSVTGTLTQAIAKADAPTIVIDTVTAVDYVPGVRAQISPTYTISGFKGTDAASTLTLTYNFVSNPFETFSYSDTRTPIDAGTYSIEPSEIVMSSGLATNYETPNYSSAAINFTVNRIAQAAITIDGVNGEVDVPFTLVYRGGNNPTGTATFTKVSGTACSVTGNGLNATEAGLCVVTVSLTGNRNYLPITSDSITVRVRSYTLIPVFVFGNGSTGISIASNTPLTKDENSCMTGCVPTLTLSTPYEGAEGDVITLTGTFFTGARRVIFNVFTDASTFSVDSDTQITVQVPAGLTPGDGTIEVVTARGVTPRYFDFTVLP